jgi:DNA-binding NarL/FixJ family response regulator
MPMAVVKLALAHQFTLFSTILKEYLSGYDNMNVTIRASSITDLFTRLESSPVDILLLDISITKKNVNEVLEALRTRYPEIKILILSEYTDSHVISSLLDVGIYGYISKTDEPEELLEAIMAAADNKIYRNKLFTEVLYWNKQKKITTEVEAPVVTLSEREQKILQLLWEEKSNREIAARLFLGVRSIEKIRHEMKEKLGVKSTVGLFKYGIERKIIDINHKELVLLNNV